MNKVLTHKIVLKLDNVNLLHLHEILTENMLVTQSKEKVSPHDLILYHIRENILQKIEKLQKRGVNTIKKLQINTSELLLLRNMVLENAPALHAQKYAINTILINLLDKEYVNIKNLITEK